MDKKQLREADIRCKFIDPALIQAGWSEAHQIYREYAITRGRIVVHGQKAQPFCRALRDNGGFK